MTHTDELAQAMTYIGRTGYIDNVALQKTARTKAYVSIRVRILNAAVQYGQARVCVAPLEGEGTVWVVLRRVRLEEEGKNASMAHE